MPVPVRESLLAALLVLFAAPDEGTRVYRNGKLELPVKGLKFKQALFGIRLCNRPADAGLKKAMLGMERS
ncbi:MAG TPA: chalcone isomerase family protein [Gammaproteobacteria bacterium]|nr:chalcone isomerase family protein [Gammaproteobacteria bacterium]